MSDFDNFDFEICILNIMTINSFCYCAHMPLYYMQVHYVENLSYDYKFPNLTIS